MCIHFGWKRTAGLICFSWGTKRGASYSLHFIVSPRHWVWGKQQSWYDGPIYEYGIGPLFLLSIV